MPPYVATAFCGTTEHSVGTIVLRKTSEQNHALLCTTTSAHEGAR